MCKSLIWRALLVGTLTLLFNAGLAWSQVTPFPSQNVIGWGGGPTQPPNVGSTDNRPQSVTAPAPSDTSSSESADSNPSDASNGNQSDNSSGGPTTVSDNNTVRQLGTPFPLQLQPEGLKIGPCYVPSVSDSFFYAVNSAPSVPSQSFTGNSISSNLSCIKTFSSGILALQARAQLSLANSWHPFINQGESLTFNDQLSERWAFNAGAQFTYFQNSILANIQYLLSYQGGVQQTLFVPQQAYTIYESNNIGFTYAMNGQTHITLSPIVGAIFSDVDGQWTSSHEFGGAIGVTRDFTPNLSLGGFYSFYHSTTSGIPGSPSWNTQNAGVTFQYRFQQSWSVAGSLAASAQRQNNVWTVTPTGSLRLSKSFRRSTFSAAYTRSEASNVLVSNGYYDQANLAYNQVINQRLSFNVGVGGYRTIDAGIDQHGKTAGGSLAYKWTPRLSLSGGYSFSHQNGAGTFGFLPFQGNTSALSLGLTWLLGAQSGL